MINPKKEIRLDLILIHHEGGNARTLQAQTFSETTALTSRHLAAKCIIAPFQY